MEISTVLNFMISHCTDSDGLVFTFALTCYQKAYFFILGGHFHWKKTITFGQLAITAMLFAKFYAGTRKQLSEFLATSA